MATTGETALLGQILAEVKAVAAEVSAVKVTVATAVAEIEHRARQGEDHETRIRHVETAVAANITQADLDALEDRRRDEVAAALLLSDKKATRRLTVIGLVMTVVIAAANYFLSH
jgi:hypothetical protein